MRVHVLLEAGETPPRELDWLADGERERLRGMRFPRRRHDFRCGRWTAKRALARVVGIPETPERLAELEVRADGRGAPTAWLRGEPLPHELSLSHRAGAVFCVVGGPGSRVGCDVEWVEPRSPEFVRHMLTQAEQRWLQRLPAEAQHEAANLIWSAKESALKATRIGLDVDVRALGLHVQTEGDGRFWIQLPAAAELLHGCWGRHGDWVWTIASPHMFVIEPLA